MPISNAVHFFTVLLSFGLVNNVIIRQGNKMDSKIMQLSSKNS